MGDIKVWSVMNEAVRRCLLGVSLVWLPAGLYVFCRGKIQYGIPKEGNGGVRCLGEVSVP